MYTCNMLSGQIKVQSVIICAIVYFIVIVIKFVNYLPITLFVNYLPITLFVNYLPIASGIMMLCRQELLQ